MELPIIFAILASFIVIISSHPKNSDIIPKDYYKRQILQPIPGYIPVYIKADGELLVRSGNKKPIVDVHSQKTSEPKEKNLSKHSDKETSLENEEKKSGTRGERIINSKNVLPKLQEKSELLKAKSANRNGNREVANSSVRQNNQKI